MATGSVAIGLPRGNCYRLDMDLVKCSGRLMTQRDLMEGSRCGWRSAVLLSADVDEGRKEGKRRGQKATGFVTTNPRVVNAKKKAGGI